MIPLIALFAVLGGSIASGSAFAQAKNNTDKPIDFKPLIPPILPPLPPNSQLNSGSVGGTQTPYTTAPLYDTTPSQPAPGLRFTIPSR
jgi:hypothetical protein